LIGCHPATECVWGDTRPHNHLSSQKKTVRTDGHDYATHKNTTSFFYFILAFLSST
jgi:hypothetical protein